MVVSPLIAVPAALLLYIAAAYVAIMVVRLARRVRRSRNERGKG
jgi:hypothetical protein